MLPAVTPAFLAGWQAGVCSPRDTEPFSALPHFTYTRLVLASVCGPPVCRGFLTTLAVLCLQLLVGGSVAVVVTDPAAARWGWG